MTDRNDGLRTRYIVDRDTLIDAYGSQSWSSPDQMADMLLDGLAEVNAPEAEVAAGPRDEGLREAAAALVRELLTSPGITTGRQAKALADLRAALAGTDE